MQYFARILRVAKKSKRIILSLFIIAVASILYFNQQTLKTYFLKGANPVAYWKLNEGVGSSAYDSVGTYMGTLGLGTSAPTWKPESECVFGKCLYFDGTSDFISLGSTPTSIKSVSFWVKPITTTQNFIDLNGAAYVSASSGTVSATGFTAPTIYINGTSSPTITANRWQHVMVTTGTGITGSAVKLGRIGSTTFNGYLDEVKLYNYARSADETKTDFIAGGGVAGDSVVLGAADPGALSDGLVGYWKMDETTWAGANAITDSSGNLNSGTAVNNATVTIGKFGNGGTFDGTNDVVRIPETTSTDLGALTDSYTVSAWFKHSSCTNDYCMIIGKNGAGSTAVPFQLMDQAVLELDIIDGNGNYSSVSSPQTYRDGLWHQVVGVRDRATDKVYLYIDGIIIDTQVDIATTSAANDDDIAIGNGDINYIGADLNGQVDEVRIYNRAFSPNEVTLLYNWAPGPVGYWDLNESSGTRYDRSGNNNNLTDNNTVISGIGKYGQAADIEKGPPDNDESLNISDAAQTKLDIGDSSAITIQAWVKAESGDEVQSIAGKDGNAGSRSYFLNWGSGNNVRLLVSHDGTNTTIITGGTTLNFNQWYHVAGVYDGAFLRLYVNGISDAIPTAYTAGFFDTSAPFAIGARGSASSADPFDGLIDEVKIYNYVRTPSQIIEDMNAGHPAVGTPVGSTVLYLKMDEGYGSTSYNSGLLGTAANATLGTGTSAPSWSNDGKFAKALDFEGTEDKVSVPDNAALDYGDQDFTLTGWFNRDTFATDDVILAKRNGDAASDNGYLVYIDDSTDQLIFEVSDGVDEYSITSASTFTATGWNYFAIAWDDDDTTNSEIYINGVDNNGTDSGTIGNIGVGTTNAVTLNLGNVSDNVNATMTSHFFDGKLDEIKIYPFALTPDNVKTDYNRGKQTVFGSLSTGIGGTANDNSSSRSYCVPGDTSTCNPPVAEWKLDEATLTSAGSIQDTSGNNDSLSAIGSPTIINGKRGYGVQYNGSNQYLCRDTDSSGSCTATEDDNSLDFGDSSDFTVAAWIYPQSNSANQFIVGKKQGLTAGTAGYALILDDTTNGVGLYVADGTDSYGVISSAITLQQWHHVEIIYDDDSTINTAVYVDGVKYQTTTSGTLANVNSLDNTRPLTIGVDGNETNDYTGYTDDIKIYDYARTPAQIAWEYNRGAPLAWYKMNENTGTTVRNWAENGNGGFTGMNGSMGAGTSTPTWTTGKFEYGLSFDGSDDYLNILDTTPLQFDTNTLDFSLFAWVKRTAAGAIHYIVSKEDADNDGWRMLINADNTATCSVNSGDITSTATIDTNWHNVGCTIDRDGVGQMYIDGKASGSSIGIGSSTMATTSDIRIGTRSYTSANYMNGLIDDLRIYNYALTVEQIRTAMTNGALRFE